MIREIIATSPQGVRLAFEASGEAGLELQTHSPRSNFMYIRDLGKAGGAAVVGVVPTSWLIELNEHVT
jgi:hypothetical protein